MTNADLEAIRQRNAARTQGVWGHEVDSDAQRVGPWTGKREDPYDGGGQIVDSVVCYWSRKDKFARLEDQTFIAHCSEDIPALLNAVDAFLMAEDGADRIVKAQEAEITRLRAALEAAKIDSDKLPMLYDEFIAHNAAIDAALRGGA